MTFDEAVKTALKGAPCFRTSKMNVWKGTSKEIRIRLYFHTFMGDNIMHVVNVVGGGELRLNADDVLANDWEEQSDG